MREYASRFDGHLVKSSSYNHACALDQFVTGLRPRMAELVTITEVPKLSQFICKVEAIKLASQYVSQVLERKGAQHLVIGMFCGRVTVKDDQVLFFIFSGTILR